MASVESTSSIASERLEESDKLSEDIGRDDGFTYALAALILSTVVKNPNALNVYFLIYDLLFYLNI